MSLGTETIVLRVCGNCRYAEGEICAGYMKDLEEAYFHCLSQQASLNLLRNRANGLKNKQCARDYSVIA